MSAPASRHPKADLAARQVAWAQLWRRLLQLSPDPPAQAGERRPETDRGPR